MHSSKNILKNVLQSIVVVLVVSLLSGITIAQGIKNYTPITSERLLNPEPENWLMYRGMYNG